MQKHFPSVLCGEMKQQKSMCFVIILLEVALTAHLWKAESSQAK